MFTFRLLPKQRDCVNISKVDFSDPIKNNTF